MIAPSLSELTRVFARIGVLSFGGPAAQIALMHRELVEARGWLDEDRFLRALSFCMMLPGPEAMQLATYAGWRLRGVPGGLIAGGLFVAPGAAVIAALVAIYARFGTLPVISAMFLGIKATVVVIVLDALLKVSRRALKTPDRWWTAGLAFSAIFLLDAPYPLIVLAAAAYGFAVTPAASATRPQPTVPDGHLRRTALIWGSLWLAPIVLVWALQAVFLTDLALYFSKLAVVTFGGAYAVLASMAQEVVSRHGWISTAQMMDGFGLAETTPGPLILVTQFVAMLAGELKEGWELGLAAGLLALWVTFVPCFLWIFAGAPYIDRLAGQPRLAGALSAITAAVVGVILNLSLWFASHVFFAEVDRTGWGPFGTIRPVLQSFDPAAAALCALAAAALLWRRWPLPVVLALAAAAGTLTLLSG
ncbi:MAG: chromate efflux transporter [Rhodobacteraceae bacterium]|nr:chromate efflux transporter [Paracoccaceae bacterium]